ncbi:MAG: hydantoinase/oxoprolinase family protein [Lachnospiraceae bacterium]|nr:hydantoinase/oxoprolinase family protein [Lachnospiraceae bacterium]
MNAVFENTKKIVLGIDTGGTYTDAVACDGQSHKIYAEAKSLTTRQDLSVGISNALSQLPGEYLRQASLVSLSTTLATNACVENKGCRALLILFGMDEASARRLGSEFGGFDTDDIWCIETDTHMDGTIGKMPDWEEFGRIIQKRYAGYEAFALVEIYAKQTGACLEKKARETIAAVLSRPTVCGHELFSEINVLKRGANAMLNARLVPLIDRFLKAVDVSLKELGVQAPVMIVRSDGTLMSREFAVTHPIETLLCGPVASVIGAEKLTGCDTAMIVDVGGTTSDVALLRKKSPVRVEEGVHIGGWTTFIKGLFVDTFGLGGDTGVRYREKKLFLDTKRLIPICILASRYPEITEELRKIAEGQSTHTRFIHEYLVLQHPPVKPEEYSEEEQRICRLLKERPYALLDVSKKLDLSLYRIDTERLERDGIILRSGLTPTDIMHLKGDFDVFCKEASFFAASYVAKNLYMNVERLCDLVYDRVKYRLFDNLARVLIEREYPGFAEMDREVLDLLLEKQWKEFCEKKELSGFFSVNISSRMAIVGLGGPAAIFVPDAAHALGAEVMIPEHAQVANALGAALGHVAYVITVTVDAVYSEEASYLAVTSSGERKPFEKDQTEEAIGYAKKRAEVLAIQEAKMRGISYIPHIEWKQNWKNYPGTEMLNQITVQAAVQERLF